VVRHDEVGLLDHGLVDDRGHRIDGEQDAPDGGVRVAAGEPDGIPVLRQVRWVPLVEQGHDVTKGERHATSHADRLRSTNL
jgi:hypothetical protein